MPSLTRTEASERAGLLTVRDYRLRLDLADDGDRFRSETRIRFESRRSGAETFAQLRCDVVDSIVLNGRELDPSAVADGRIQLSDLRPVNELSVLARPAYSSDGEGLHRHIDPADGRRYLYAMSFLDAAPRWFACFDQPDLKAPVDIDVTCPPGWRVLGNSPAVEQAPGRWKLAAHRPLSTYFTTLVAGPYHSVQAEHDGIRLGLHARASLAEHLDAQAAEILQTTRACLDRYHELFGIRYPFGEYHQAFVPDFNAGAMENPGCVTLRDQYVFSSAVTTGERGARAGVIAHEMAHMWFGDLVTMRWWDDLWLNESFAEYLAARVCSEVTDFPAWTEFGIRRKDWGFVADQAPSTHPVAGNGATDAAGALADFDGISYSKGASVLKQLAARLGDEVFFAGLRDYFRAHRFGNAAFADLIRAWQDAGADELGPWAEQWLRTSGLDTLSAAREGDAIVLRRTAPDGTRRPHSLRLVGLDSNGQPVVDEPVTITGASARVPAPRSVVVSVADGGDDSWAKIRFGEDGWRSLRDVLPLVGSSATRVVIYNAIRDGVRDAELAPDDALDLLLAAVAVEPVGLVAAELMSFAIGTLAGAFCPENARAGRLRRIASIARELLDRAPAGSDGQLEAARALIRAGSEPRLLAGWLRGERVPDGLLVDSELRWSLLVRLAELGELQPGAIEQELMRDNSATAVVHAARARASRPDDTAKRASWDLLTRPSDTPAYELYATANGFFLPGQQRLTSAYVPRYFAEMPGTAAHRQGWAQARVALACYPTNPALASTVELAETTLERTDMQPGLRRSIVDGTHALSRAVRSLQTFGP